MGSLAARVLCLVLISSCLVARDWRLVLIVDYVMRNYFLSINTLGFFLLGESMMYFGQN